MTLPSYCSLTPEFLMEPSKKPCDRDSPPPPPPPMQGAGGTDRAGQGESSQGREGARGREEPALHGRGRAAAAQGQQGAKQASQDPQDQHRQQEGLPPRPNHPSDALPEREQEKTVAS